MVQESASPSTELFLFIHFSKHIGPVEVVQYNMGKGSNACKNNRARENKGKYDHCCTRLYLAFTH